MLRRLDIILAIGRDDPSRGNNEHISGSLEQGYLARTAALGRVGARLALVAGDDRHYVGGA
jgi:hypothetical protein